MWNETVLLQERAENFPKSTGSQHSLIQQVEWHLVLKIGLAWTLQGRTFGFCFISNWRFGKYIQHFLRRAKDGYSIWVILKKIVRIWTLVCKLINNHSFHFEGREEFNLPNEEFQLRTSQAPFPGTTDVTATGASRWALLRHQTGSTAEASG